MTTASEQLTSVQAAISAMESQLAGVNVEEYQLPGGQKVRRAAFDKTLKELYAREKDLLRRVSRASANPLRVGKIGRPRGVDRS